MNQTELNKRRAAAIETVLAKMPSNLTNDATKAEIRALSRGDGDHELVALYRLVETLANHPN